MDSPIVGVFVTNNKNGDVAMDEIIRNILSKSQNLCILVVIMQITGAEGYPGKSLITNFFNSQVRYI
jgi:hypothetical protein